MAQALFDKSSGPAETEEVSPGIVGDLESSFYGTVDSSQSQGWPERRLQFRSEVHKSDRKIATALYVVFTLVLFSIVGV